jgi:hypothetical protein
MASIKTLKTANSELILNTSDADSKFDEFCRVQVFKPNESKKKASERTVKPRSTHSPSQSSKNTPSIKTLKSVIPSSPKKNYGLTPRAVTALKKRAHKGDVDAMQ